MRLLLMLYSTENYTNSYAEGMIHFDGRVYINGFYPSVGELFLSVNNLKNYMLGLEYIKSFSIVEIDAKAGFTYL